MIEIRDKTKTPGNLLTNFAKVPTTAVSNKATIAFEAKVNNKTSYSLIGQGIYLKSAKMTAY